MRPIRFSYSIFIFLMFSLSPEGSAQQNVVVVDSLLRNRAEQRGADLAITNLYIAQQLIYIDHDSADIFITLAEEYNADNYKKDVAALILKLRGLLAELNYEYELSMELRRRAYGLYKELGNLNEMGWTSRGIGITFYDLGNYENAAEYYMLSLSAFEEDENKRGIADIYNLMGTVQYVSGHEDKALEYYTSASEIFST